MTFKISNFTSNSMVDAFSLLLNGGTMQARSGAQPATVDAAASGSLLATLDYLADSAPDAALGVATVTLPVSGVATGAGTMGWARAYKSTGEAVFDGTITLTGNGGDLIATNLTVAVDDVVQLTLQTFTLPKE